MPSLSRHSFPDSIPRVARRSFLLLAALAAGRGSLAAARVGLTNFRFGVVREVASGIFEFVAETTRLPRQLKNTGFRWGLGFENPECKPIEWYEVLHLPGELKEVSGNFQRTRSQVMRTKTFQSAQASVVDDFWFDDGDPLGNHRIELFVNGTLRHAVDFQVVASE